MEPLDLSSSKKKGGKYLSSTATPIARSSSASELDAKTPSKSKKPNHA